VSHFSSMFLNPSLTLYFHWPHHSPNPNSCDNYSSYIAPVSRCLWLSQLFHFTHVYGADGELQNVISQLQPHTGWKPKNKRISIWWQWKLEDAVNIQIIWTCKTKSNFFLQIECGFWFNSVELSSIYHVFYYLAGDVGHNHVTVLLL
jgi:hypothetical protein